MHSLHQASRISHPLDNFSVSAFSIESYRKKNRRDRKSLRCDFARHTRRRSLRNPAEALLFLVLILPRKTADGKERADRLQPPGLRPKKRSRQSTSTHMFSFIHVHVSRSSYFFCFQPFSLLGRILSILFLLVKYLTYLSFRQNKNLRKDLHSWVGLPETASHYDTILPGTPDAAPSGIQPL